MDIPESEQHAKVVTLDASLSSPESWPSRTAGWGVSKTAAYFSHQGLSLSVQCMSYIVPISQIRKLSLREARAIG